VIDLRADSTPGLVSVVIPTHNRAHFLRSAIESVLGQSYPALELIVVDDGSTDDTRSIVKEYGDRAKYLFQEGPRGPAAARNRGIQEAAGEFIAFLDSDDVWLRDKLQKQLTLFQKNPSVGMVGGGCTYTHRTGQSVGSTVFGPWHIEYEDFAVSAAMPGSASNAVIRRSALVEVGMFDESLHRAEDRELWMRISQKFPVRCVRSPTVLIRVHAEPRPGSGWKDILFYRRQVNARIPNQLLRRKAEAWMWYTLFDRQLQQRGRNPLAFCFLLRSFVSYPYRIGARNRRLRPCLARVLPNRAVSVVRRLV
jgi:glycosyltransferase involved in cell wall biosynthesis